MKYFVLCDDIPRWSVCKYGDRQIWTFQWRRQCDARRYLQRRRFQDPMLLQIYIDFWIDDTRIAREHQFNLDHNCSWSKKEKAAKKYGIHLLWHHTTMPLIHIMNLDIYCRRRSGALIGFFEVGFTLRLNKLIIFFHCYYYCKYYYKILWPWATIIVLSS